MTRPERVLGIETSCDETAAAVVESGARVLSSVVRGQDAVHAPYGGVVPELASRDHLGAVSAVVERALAEAGVGLAELSGVAVTAGPGLLGSLLVGLSFGKALAYRAGLPCVGVHHLAGHLAAAELADPALRPPYVGLVVSGGHTALYRIEADAPAALLGETRDDAVGEAFDKVAKLLGLPFPGGPALARLAEQGDEAAVAFPRPLAGQGDLDFSYSGLKTAVSDVIAELEARGGTREALSDVAASFQEAAVEVLVRKTLRAVEQTGCRRVLMGGGVSVNRRLREAMSEALQPDGQLFHASPRLSLDNGAMVARAGRFRHDRGESASMHGSASASLPFPGLVRGGIRAAGPRRSATAPTAP